MENGNKVEIIQIIMEVADEFSETFRISVLYNLSSQLTM